jgi:hypothetical protein
LRRKRERDGSLFRFDAQGYIDVLEYLTRDDTENAVGGFDEVVALASGVLTAENVGEGEAGIEWLGFDQKTGAIGDPSVRGFHGWQFSVLSSQF